MIFRLSLPAQRDIDDIWDYIARDKPSAATRFTGQLSETFSILAAQPRIGRPCDELGRGLYRFPAGNYLVFYRIHRNCIEIARILHGARDIEALFYSEQNE